MTLVLPIEHTWDGTLLPRAEVATLTLRAAGQHLAIESDAPFAGDPLPPGPPGPTAGLWNFEVVELFIACADDPLETVRYTEIELGPHGHHLVLKLRGVRQMVRDRLPLDYSVERDVARWQGRALLERELLPPAPHRVNAYAIRGQGTARQYHAMVPVPGKRPDFHRPELFQAVELP